jgi:hypothetical protein
MERKLLFSKNEVIWAKIRGYAWWPGIVRNNVYKAKNISEENIKVLVNFLGDNTHAEVPLDKVEKYNDKYKEYSKTKKNSLLKAIAIANNILKGKITYEQSVNIIKENNNVVDLLKLEV